MGDDEERDEIRRREQPASLQELVERARALRTLMGDENWLISVESRFDVLTDISQFMSAIGNMAEPKESEYTLEHRLARVEVHRVYGACVLFDRTTERIAGFQSDDPLDEPNTNEADKAAVDLYIALGQFIAMAERL